MLREWINFISILYEKTLKEYMVDKNVDKREVLDMENFHNQYTDKRKKFSDTTKFEVEYIFSDVISQEFKSLEQVTKLNNFSVKILWI